VDIEIYGRRIYYLDHSRDVKVMCRNKPFPPSTTNNLAIWEEQASPSFDTTEHILWAHKLLDGLNGFVWSIDKNFVTFK